MEAVRSLTGAEQHEEYRDMVQGKREWLALGVAWAVAGRVGGLKAATPCGLGMEVLEGRVNLSSMAGAAPVSPAAGATATTGEIRGYRTVLSLQAALGQNVSALPSNGKGQKDVVYASPARRSRPSRVLKQLDQDLTPIEVPNMTPSPIATPTVTPKVSPGQAQLNTLRSALYGDDQHDDSSTIQAMVDLAYADNLTSITLPAGTFKLSKQIVFYGTGVTLSGAGNQTILDVANHHDGYGHDGWAIRVIATLDPNLAMVDSAVTGDTITLRGQFNYQPGQQLFLSNGSGSAKLIEQKYGGRLLEPGEFQELGPDEYVTVASASVNAEGNTVLKLTKSVVGTNDYFNVAPQGVSKDTYLCIRAVDRPANHLTVSDLAIRFSDALADSSIFAFYTTYFTVRNVTVLNSAALHGNGAVWSDGCMYTTFENINAPLSALSFNSTRFGQIMNCNASNITTEEGTTDCLITHNTLNTTTYCALRTNDMSCQRITFSYNTMKGGTDKTGAIGIWEGLDISVMHNVATGGVASIWIDYTLGTVVTGNTADVFYNFNTRTPITLTQNSWQTHQ